MIALLPAAALMIAACEGESAQGAAPPTPQITAESDGLTALPPAEAITISDRSPAETRRAHAGWQEPAFENQTRAPKPAQSHAWATQSVASGLNTPWAFEFLPDGRMILTEKAGVLRIVSPDGAVGGAINGLPEIATRGQGGFLDVALSPDFETDRMIYLTFAESRDGGWATSAGRGRLSDDEASLEGFEVIFRQFPGTRAGQHFGSRLAFSPDGLLFITLGDRGARDEAQDRNNYIGAVARIHPDGTIPADNPFTDGPARALWSYGHRNVQASDIHPETGALWTLEHGPRGGDELNIPVRGANHGWPVVSYGENYSGTRLGEGITQAEGIIQPVYYWDPVIAPGGMDFYGGDLFPAWRGDLFVGGLVSARISRLVVEDGRVTAEEWLDVDARARDVRQGPDGAIYYLAQNAGEIRRLMPAVQ